MNELSLFSGYGGFSLGLRLAGLDVRTVGYVEWEKYPQEIIKARIRDGYLDDAPIFSDIRAFDGKQYRGLVDIVTAGFPCQPHSTAGRRKGASDERNLWPDTCRTIDEVGPSYVLLENVAGLLSNGYAGTVVGELASIGYDSEWHLVPAAAVGAPHLRWRWWCLAYPDTDGERRLHREPGEQPTDRGLDAFSKPTGLHSEVSNPTDNGRPARGRATEQERQHQAMGWGEQPGANGEAGEMADTDGTGCVQQWRSVTAPAQHKAPQRGSWWVSEPDVGRVVDGSPARVDQITALGNGIVPAQAAFAIRNLFRLAGG